MRVFERLERDRRRLLGLAVCLGLAGLMLPDVEGARLREGFVGLALFVSWLAGFRIAYTLDEAELSSRIQWLRWPWPRLLGGVPMQQGELQEIRCGRSLESHDEAWNVTVISPVSALAMPYRDEASMQADLDAVLALCPRVVAVRDDVEVPRDAETHAVFEHCDRTGKGLLQFAAVWGLAAVALAAFGQSALAGMCFVCAGVFAWFGCFRLEYTLTGMRLTETVRWLRWPFPTWFRHSLPLGVGMLRQVRVGARQATGWRVSLHTSGGFGFCTYRVEAQLQADLDALRAHSPQVPIVRM